MSKWNMADDRLKLWREQIRRLVPKTGSLYKVISDNELCLFANDSRRAADRVLRRGDIVMMVWVQPYEEITQKLTDLECFDQKLRSVEDVVFSFQVLFEEKVWAKKQALLVGWDLVLEKVA